MAAKEANQSRRQNWLRRRIWKRQEFDWTKENQRRREDRKGRWEEEKSWLVGRRKDNKVRRMLAKGENVFVSKDAYQQKNPNLVKIKLASAKAGWRQI